MFRDVSEPKSRTILNMTRIGLFESLFSLFSSNSTRMVCSSESEANLITPFGSIETSVLFSRTQDDDDDVWSSSSM